MNRHIPVLRVVSALVAVVGLVGLVSVWQNTAARADTPIDQITGNGTTNSEVTVTWAKGLTGADNSTVVASRDPNSPYVFMHPDFQNLSVTVSQTKNLVHQSIKVTWTGGKETQQPFKADFLQMMQCYGDADTGPTPEQCVYGSRGLLAGSSPLNPGVGGRIGNVCASHTPSTTNPPGTIGGLGASIGCDPSEPNDQSHTNPNAGTSQLYSVPFVPVGLTEKVYGVSTEFYDQYNSNEVQEASTSPDGKGQVFFQTLTSTQAPGLGCGLLKENGQPRDCWLVIVPRGEMEPNGWQVNGSLGRPGYINESPLGAASWAQRIQIHLSFAPLQPNCPIGSAKERGTIGSELVAHAVFSWQLALNSSANCKTLYGYAITPEATNTAQLATQDGAGLAFTTVPVGNEAARNGSTVPKLPPLVYAPMAVTAVTFGFNVNLENGFRTTPAKLTPRLVAKALTQSYRFELPDVDSDHPGPSWATNNPNYITTDPEFTKLNPGLQFVSGTPIAPLLTEDQSGVNQQVWAWVLADAAARSWLAGQPDENGMVVNPSYKNLHLDAAPVDSYPRADQTCFNTGAPGERDPGRCSLDLLPYMNNYDDAASHVRKANNPEGAGWDPGLKA